MTVNEPSPYPSRDSSLFGPGLRDSIRIWGRMIKFEYSLFALPYAFLGAFLAARGLPPLVPLLWLTVAMVGIRSFAMTLNRLADLELDRLNPRTAKRALITGEISLNAARVFAFVSVVIYFLACACLGKLLLILSPVPVLVIIVYSWAKRFTWATHFILGLCHSFSPVAGWMAVDPRVTPQACLFSCAMLFWTAGFDIIYSTMDTDFDRAMKLHSVPARVGVPAALDIAAICHGVFALFLGMAFWLNGLGWVGGITWLLVAVLLVWEHRLVKPDDMQRVNTAFFTLNSLIAGLILAGVLLALFIQRGV